MIKRLTLADDREVKEFLKEEASINLFIIGDLETFGYETEFQDLWGDYGENGNLRAVLLRFYDSYIPYAKGDFDTDGFIGIIKKNKNVSGISGKADIVAKFESELSECFTKKQTTFFAECTMDSFTGCSVNPLHIKQANFSDIDRIIALRETIKEFMPNPNAKEILKKSMETRTGRTYIYEVDGQLAAAASTTAENTFSAMVVGVCTAEDYRNQGFASLVVKTLTADILSEGKSLCLFFDNPAAGRIYQRLGYKTIGHWIMYQK
ncbi:GNAT family N-acetyltransferase [Bacillus sp. V5-8f]|uniref:GNAT family N-acetyltransferase n=1 Tax=Bacillus sp. V5-8f TaxID=2053044 RepID=UPI000C78E1D8|nr:GNAT family N-acetyltransferase [Bacillus sp. V5-8f]PLT34157.1 GNAT family N-acetyltransferase [Bacillus sp. V5-8f]